MTRLTATVICPTFDHGPTLRHSVGSALRQTVQDLEVFIVGDGMPPAARAVARELAEDPRVRLFEDPKGPRNGEMYRRDAIAAASGDIICYLSDDDLWLPHHVETIAKRLQDADFAHTLPVIVHSTGHLGVLLIDLEQPWYTQELLAGRNRVPLSTAGHTVDAYRRLPHGWRTTPAGTPTDLYMWQQFLESGLRCVSSPSYTVANFPSPERKTWTIDERLEELREWEHRLADTGAPEGVLSSLLMQATAFEVFAHAQSERADAGEVRVANLNRTVEGLRLTLDVESSERAALRAQLDRVDSSLTWRLRGAILALPVLGRALRMAGTARARVTALRATQRSSRGRT